MIFIKTYTWYSEEKTQLPSDEKTIIATETVTETKEEKFTLKQKQEELANAQTAVLNAQKRVEELKAEIEAIKTTLGVK